MSHMVGADVAELRQLASTFNARAAQLKSIESQLNWRIHAAPWEGHDVSRFVNDWNTRHRRVIAAAAASITNAAQELLANADQQERASTAGAPGGFPSFGSLRGFGERQVGPAGGVAVLADWIRRFVPVRGDLIGLIDGTGHSSGSVWAGVGSQSRASHSFDGSSVTGSIDATARAGIGASGDSAYSAGPLSASAHGDVFAGAQAHAGASGTIGPDGATVQAEAGAMVGVEANASAAMMVGGLAAYSANAHGFAGATATGNARGHIGRDGVEGTVGGNAFAGARVNADVTQDILGVKSTVGASARAGIGADASGELKMTYDDVHVGFDIGVAVGLGAGVSVSYDLSPREMVHGIAQLGGGVDQATTTGAKFVKSHWPF